MLFHIFQKKDNFSKKGVIHWCVKLFERMFQTHASHINNIIELFR